MSFPFVSNVSSSIIRSRPRQAAAGALKSRVLPRPHVRRAAFHSTTELKAIKPFLLADVGEGTTECQIIQWFVQPGAKVSQFDKICEVQSDKTATEITSRYDGVIKKLYYEADDTAIVGKPLVDIDIDGEISAEDEAVFESDSKAASPENPPPPPSAPSESSTSAPSPPPASTPQQTQRQSNGKSATMATPAVRHLSKELGIDIAIVQGTGRDGRVLKEDLQKFAAAKQEPAKPVSLPIGEDKVIPLTGVQNAMFKAMTKSLQIPHFLYSDSVDFSTLTALRKRLNTSNASDSSETIKYSALPFIIKAASLAFTAFPALNAHLDTSDPNKPVVSYKASHNIGVAIDTPQGLVVPVISNVQSLSIGDIAAELARFSTLARANKLSQADLTGATFTVSNIGSIGGLAVAPVIVPPQVAILGVGRSRTVPAFGENGEIVKREEAVFSWSADHRVVDGALAARCAEKVRWFLEGPERMVVGLR